MLVSSRSYEEYVAFFALTEEDLAGLILDCSAGASSFTAVAASHGANVLAVDPAYSDPAALLDSATGSQRRGDAILEQHDSRFEWTWYGTPQRRREMRATALNDFVRDFQEHPSRYKAGALPRLPLEDRAFDLALCSHLLFTWSDTFDERWHREGITELLRVARELRVFPLVRQGDGAPVPFLSRIIETLREDGYHAQVQPVPYTFQRGASEMLRVSR